jgi:hypothetical protein
MPKVARNAGTKQTTMSAAGSPCRSRLNSAVVMSWAGPGTLRLLVVASLSGSTPARDMANKVHTLW